MDDNTENQNTESVPSLNRMTTQEKIKESLYKKKTMGFGDDVTDLHIRELVDTLAALAGEISEIRRFISRPRVNVRDEFVRMGNDPDLLMVRTSSIIRIYKDYSDDCVIIGFVDGSCRKFGEKFEDFCNRMIHVFPTLPYTRKPVDPETGTEDI